MVREKASVSISETCAKWCRSSLEPATSAADDERERSADPVASAQS